MARAGSFSMKELNGSGGADAFDACEKRALVRRVPWQSMAGMNIDWPQDGSGPMVVFEEYGSWTYLSGLATMNKFFAISSCGECISLLMSMVTGIIRAFLVYDMEEIYFAILDFVLAAVHCALQVSQKFYIEDSEIYMNKAMDFGKALMEKIEKKVSTLCIGIGWFVWQMNEHMSYEGMVTCWLDGQHLWHALDEPLGLCEDGFEAHVQIGEKEAES